MKVESNKFFENPSPSSNRCLRRNGTHRAWFLNREEAERFAASPANPAYRGDIAHLCAKCDHYHLSKPSWLEGELTSEDYQLLEAARIQTPLRCTICGRAQGQGIDFFILRNGALRCSKCVEDI
jgi:hypothetical protein